MRLTTSNPTPAYVERVATTFNDNGQGVRGDIKAVVKAILLDDEARGVDAPEHFGKTDELLTTFTHMLKTFDVKPMSGWKFKKSGTNTVMTNEYWINTDLAFRQAPLSASSVFNFYSPDFVPSDPSFATNKLVSPELEIQNAPQLIGFSNLIEDMLASQASDASGKTNTNQGLAYLDLSRELSA
jgi:uncharacterized protein (DUF1800 family)